MHSRPLPRRTIYYIEILLLVLEDRILLFEGVKHLLAIFEELPVLVVILRETPGGVPARLAPRESFIGFGLVIGVGFDLLDMLLNLTPIPKLLVTFVGDVVNLIHAVLGLEPIEAVDLIELEDAVLE